MLLFKRPRRPLMVWLLINLLLLVGVPIWAYLGLLNEVAAERQSGAIGADGDTITIPLMGILMGVVIAALAFNILWGSVYLLVRRKRRTMQQGSSLGGNVRKI